MKFLVLLFYYERPDLLKNALMSVKASTHENWDMCIIDDGTVHPAFSLVNECFSHDERLKHNISYIQTFDSEEKKAIRGGSRFGEYANAAIKASDSDVVLMLCDDDLLMPKYMEELDIFYRNNPNIKYSYSHLKFYDPTFGNPNECNQVNDEYTSYLNSKREPINPVRQVDSSQVSWRRKNWIDDGMKFPSPRTANLDEVIYGHMYSAWGECQFNGIIGQWKGIHDGQLINLSRNN